MPDAINYDLTDLSLAERLWLWRKAEGLTMTQAGTIWGISVDAYERAERGKRVVRVEKNAHRLALLCTDKHALPLLLRLARKRCGLGSRGTAVAAGYHSHVALLKAERAGDAGLVAWWREKRGFVGF